MAKALTLKNCVQAINEHGILLIYPQNNQKEPLSLWTALWPRSKLVWSWDEDSDPRVSDLWYMREKLSKSGKVVYTKWYKGRATVFSRPVFCAYLCLMGSTHVLQKSLSPVARQILECLELNSPQSIKQLKKETGLTGKFLKADFEKGLKELWEKLLIVGFGEIDDGAFPSLAIGSTKMLFEDLWLEASEMSRDEAQKNISLRVPKGSSFLKALKNSV